MKSRCFLLVLLFLAASLARGLAEEPSEGALLYNGVRLPKVWPPRQEQITREPMPVPYLEHPPAVIPIDVGRQLLVDDFLIDATTLRRTFHQAHFHPASPVLKPDQPWEQQGRLPTAMVFSDGVCYDPGDKLFKMWYMGGYCTATCYATSRDGIRWEKPSLDVEPGTNVVLRHSRDSSTVWLDHRETNPARRFKMFTYDLSGAKDRGLVFRVSADGIHWSQPVAASPSTGDRTTVFYNPFRQVWVYSLRIGLPGLGRARAYREHADAEAGLQWQGGDTCLWTAADRLDPHNPNADLSGVEPQLYNLDAVAYESVLLGLFSIWQGDPASLGRPVQKRNEVLVGFSRDGFHWDRPDRRPFAGVNESEGAWNWANVQSAGGGCLVVGDQLYFYTSGREQSNKTGRNSTGLALLRRDGFASLDAGAAEGILCTRPVSFRGKHLFVNVDADQGQLLVEILDPQGNVIEPFTRANCVPLQLDKTLAAVTWAGAADLSALSGKPVKFRFFLRNGSLYSFWVSPEATGESHGYVAAGGPGLLGPIDAP